MKRTQLFDLEKESPKYLTPYFTAFFPIEILRLILGHSFGMFGLAAVRMVVVGRAVCKKWCGMLEDPTLAPLYKTLFETTAPFRIPSDTLPALPSVFGPLFWVRSLHFCHWILGRKSLIKSFEITANSSFSPPLKTDLLLIGQLGTLGVLSPSQMKSWVRIVTSYVLPKGIVKLREHFVRTKKHRSLDLTHDEQQFVTFKGLLDSTIILYHNKVDVGTSRRITVLFTILKGYVLLISPKGERNDLKVMGLEKHKIISRLYLELFQKLGLQCTQKQFYEFVGEVCGGYEDYHYVSSTNVNE